MELRKPAVGGSFYPDSFQELEGAVGGCFLHAKGPGALPVSKRSKKLAGIIAPHAGYYYSGPCAAWAFKEVAESVFADTYLIIGTNHAAYPRTATLSVDWQTPLGVVKTDAAFCRELVKRGLAVDEKAAHLHEHSVEVQLPFLQFVSRDRLPDLQFVPLVLAPDLSVKEFSLDLQELIMDSGKRVCIIVSADFTHYGPNYGYLPFTENVQKKLPELDMGAIKLIKALDGKGFFEYVRDTGATICGHLPIAVLLETLGKCSPQLLQYYTSADIAGGWRNAVGYAAVSFGER